VKYSYYGVVDRGVPTVVNPGLPTQTVERVSQGGHEQQLGITSLLKNDWRFVADVNELSSLTFRLAFADTFGDAINSEVRSSIFVTHHFDSFSLNFAALNDKSFLTINPQTSVSLRNAPEGRFSSVERFLRRDVPIYFGDPIVRRAGSLQRTRDALPPRAWLGPALEVLADVIRRLHRLEQHGSKRRRLRARRRPRGLRRRRRGRRRGETRRSPCCAWRGRAARSSRPPVLRAPRTRSAHQLAALNSGVPVVLLHRDATEQLITTLNGEA